jgi:phosphoglycerate dehydrogenase-like enzyme
MSEPLRVTIGPPPGSLRLHQAVAAADAVVVDPADADVLVWETHKPDGFSELLAKAEQVRWVQLSSAGIEWLFKRGLYRPDLTWTCAKGDTFSPNVADLTVALILAARRELHRYLRATTWGPEGGTPIQGSNVVILGGGGITEALLPRLGPFGVTSIVVRRQPEPLPGATETVPSEAFSDVIPRADFVVLAAPLTPETRHIIDAAALARFRPDAWLINVARGGLVDTDALVHALRAGQLGGAALDVTDPEPLPDGHPLWDMDNVIITPHVANTAAMSPGPFAARVQENLRRWQTGQPLLGLIDGAAGF